MLSTEGLASRAHDVISCIDDQLRDQNFIERGILNVYREFCHSDGAQKLNITERPITHELRLRLWFECLCFATLGTTFHSRDYLTERKWFKKRPNEKLINIFNGAIGAALIEICNSEGIQNLRDIVPVAIEPDLVFGFGEHLNPLKRLDEYLVAFGQSRNSGIERFGKWIGITLDPPNYPILESIGSAFSVPLLHISKYAVIKAFT